MGSVQVSCFLSFVSDGRSFNNVGGRTGIAGGDPSVHVLTVYRALFVFVHGRLQGKDIPKAVVVVLPNSELEGHCYMRGPRIFVHDVPDVFPGDSLGKTGMDEVPVLCWIFASSKPLLSMRSLRIASSCVWFFRAGACFFFFFCFVEI